MFSKKEVDKKTLEITLRNLTGKGIIYNWEVVSNKLTKSINFTGNKIFGSCTYIRSKDKTSVTVKYHDLKFQAELKLERIENSIDYTIVDCEIVDYKG